MEDNFPNIEINSCGKIHFDDGKKLFYWEITTHISGLDDIKKWTSPLFSTKQRATENLLELFQLMIKDQLTELLA